MAMGTLTKNPLNSAEIFESKPRKDESLQNGKAAMRIPQPPERGQVQPTSIECILNLLYRHFVKAHWVILGTALNHHRSSCNATLSLHNAAQVLQHGWSLGVKREAIEHRSE